MLRVYFLATAVCFLSLRDARAGLLDWTQDHPLLVKYGVAVGSGVLKGFLADNFPDQPDHPIKNMLKNVAGGVTNQLIDEGGKTLESN